MRPTLQEQLLGTCRILEEVVAPCVGDSYARTMLEGLVGNLRMLGAALPAVPGFLADDNRATCALLARVRDVAAPDLAERIAMALAQHEPDAVNLDGLEQRNVQLRALLSQALSGTDLAPEPRAAALAHLSERARHAPMRYVSTTSATKGN